MNSFVCKSLRAWSVYAALGIILAGCGPTPGSSSPSSSSGSIHPDSQAVGRNAASDSGGPSEQEVKACIEATLGPQHQPNAANPNQKLNGFEWSGIAYGTPSHRAAFEGRQDVMVYPIHPSFTILVGSPYNDTVSRIDHTGAKAEKETYFFFKDDFDHWTFRGGRNGD